MEPLSSSDRFRHEASDPAGAGQRFDDLRPLLVRYFGRRLNNAADAEDLAQEVCARLIKRDADGASEDVRHPTAFVFKVAANALTDHYRRESARHAGDHDDVDEVEQHDESPSAERVFSGRQSLEKVVAALEELTPKCRSIFMLIRYEGLSYAEVAKRYGVSVSAIEKQVAHALEHLTRCYSSA